ncbi:YHYH protein [Psychromonas algarum]|uniref:YHYH protein n=1 Tax=Psychromonas algarum TaxID=2555643 RepID=UPI00141A06C6|nr:YHYH protein [Psychromonas sp. RZ22]
MKPSLILLCSLLLTACGTSNEANEANQEVEDSEVIDIDITDSIFTRTSGNCADYVERYYSYVQDQGRSKYFTGELFISINNESCLFQSNAIPNHDFNINGNFATAVSKQNDSYSIPTNPTLADKSSDLILGESAVFLNGVKLDLLAAACYDIGDEDLGKEKIGCGQNQINNPWRYDPMSPLNSFGTDQNNAHTQPDGTYHYHGSPMAMFDNDCSTSSPVIGFALDGFPIMGSCINDNGNIREVTSSYQLKNNGGLRSAVSGYTTPLKGQGNIVSGNYDGQFRGDWEFVEGAGDLDECNGMTVNGQYAYYVTNSYPWVMSCYSGVM